MSPRACQHRRFDLIQQGWITGLTLLSLPLAASDFTDPAPPEVSTPPAGAVAAAPVAIPGLTYHAAPAPLSPEAVTADWPRFLGPTDDVKTSETHLLDRFPEGGPKKVWELEKGISYTTPVIAGGKLVIFNRFEDEEVIQCLEPETGKQFWSHRYPVTYTDRYGFNGGPAGGSCPSDHAHFLCARCRKMTCMPRQPLPWVRAPKGAKLPPTGRVVSA
jgi:hypothetical protein